MSANCLAWSAVKFQFLIGRLDTPVPGMSRVRKWMFQFLIGRLDTRAEERAAGRFAGFQFLIGRLDTLGRD